MINYKTSDGFFVVETPKQGGGNIETIYLRQYFALKVGEDMFQVLNVDTKSRLYLTKIADVTIDGVVFTNNDLFILELNKVLFAIGSSTTTATLSAKIPMIDPSGVLVWQNVMSDGSATYTLQDGTAYSGNIILLLPYTKGGEESETFIITDFTKTAVVGGFEYLLLQSAIGITLINSVTEKTGMLSLSYTITQTNDVVITSTIEYPIDTKIRISGQA
jgi:hypothetical protein